VLILSSLLWWTPAAIAEDFLLLDGTKFSGKLLAVDGDSLQVETLYGKITIPRSNLRSITFISDDQPTTTREEEGFYPTVEQSLTGTLYTNKTGMFELTVPAGWAISETIRKRLSKESPVVAALDSADKLLAVIVSKQLYPGSIKSFQELSESMLDLWLPGYKRIEDSQVDIAGQSRGCFIYVHKSDGFALRSLSCLLATESSMITITGGAPDALFNEMRPTLEQIIGSFKFIQ
jgi:hypothetical protein